MFDASQFLDTTINESNEKRPPLPTENPDSPDGLYTAVVGEIKPRAGEKDGKPWVSMGVPLAIEVPASLQASMKLPPQLTITDNAFIDITEGGLIDNTPGKNRRQKQYRDATGQNTPGQPWSWRKLTGQVVKIRISHDDYQGAIQERIAGISKI